MLSFDKAEAARLRLPVSTIVLDRGGALLIVETDDNAPPGASEASIMKARGAAWYGIATHKTADYLKNVPPQIAQHALSLTEACAFQGGVPDLPRKEEDEFANNQQNTPHPHLDS